MVQTKENNSISTKIKRNKETKTPNSKKHLKILKGKSEAMNRSTDNKMWPKEKGQTMAYKTLHRKLSIQQQTHTKSRW